jgi:Fur family transcriptional regulator, peroxide stress response regulator
MDGEYITEEIFKGLGIRLTPQRIELARILRELEKEHPSFNRIYKAVRAKHPNVSRSTVYDNLKLLVNLDVLTSFHYRGEIHYEMDQSLHINLAEADGKIKDIKNEEVMKHLKEIVKLLEEEEHIQIKNFTILAE